MVEALVFTMIVVAVALAIAGFSLFVWLFLLPFRIVGFLFKLALGLLALPIALVFGVLGLSALGVGALVLLFPLLFVIALPILLFVWVIRASTNGHRGATHASR